jgi:hypothetical protein
MIDRQELMNVLLNGPPRMTLYDAQTQANRVMALIKPDPNPTAITFPDDEGEALMWLIDFCLDARGKTFRAIQRSRWPAQLRCAERRLLEAGYKSPHSTRYDTADQEAL